MTLRMLGIAILGLAVGCGGDSTGTSSENLEEALIQGSYEATLTITETLVSKKNPDNRSEHVSTVHAIVTLDPMEEVGADAESAAVTGTLQPCRVELPDEKVGGFIPVAVTLADATVRAIPPVDLTGRLSGDGEEARILFDPQTLSLGSAAEPVTVEAGLAEVYVSVDVAFQIDGTFSRSARSAQGTANAELDKVVHGDSVPLFSAVRQYRDIVAENDIYTESDFVMKPSTRPCAQWMPPR